MSSLPTPIRLPGLAPSEIAWRKQVARQRPFTTDGHVVVGPQGGHGMLERIGLTLRDDHAEAVDRRLHADVVALSRLRGRRSRLRAFYRDTDTTMSVHRRWRVRESPLANGARVQRSVSVTDMVVPKVLSSGRTLRYDWVVETLVVGTPVDARGWIRFAPIVLQALNPVWSSQGVAAVAAERVHGALDAAHVEQQLRDLCRSGVRDEALASDLEAAIPLVMGVLAATDSLMVGTCHGDPVRGNTLITESGQIALLDWEMAGPRPIAHDVVKVLLGLPDPIGSLRTARVVSLESWGQLVRELIVTQAWWSAGWSRQQAIAQSSGRADAFGRRLDARVRMLLAFVAVSDSG